MEKVLFGNENNIFRNAALWNMASGMLSAAQSPIILISVSRKLNTTDVGIFMIGFAIAILVSTIGRYGVRNYQVTDQDAGMHFGSYLTARYITMVITVLGLFAYLLWMYSQGGYSYYKILIILELSALKLIDALEDAYLGLYQQNGRLDVAAKIMTIRLFLTTVVICGCIEFGCSMQMAIVMGIFISVIIDVILISITLPYFRAFKGSRGSDSCRESINRVSDWKSVKYLLKACFPLCIGISLSVYIGNAPKYVIDMHLNEEIQAIFGFLMMPVFLIMIMNNFIYQPIIKQLGDMWNTKKYKEFRKRIIKQYGIVLILMFMIVSGGAWLGIPILSFIYQIDLSDFRTEFIVLLFGGGLYALANFLSVPITVIRRQKSIAIGYLITVAVVYLFGGYFAITFGMMGAAMLYLIVNSILVLFFSFVLLERVQKRIGERKVVSDEI